MSSTISPLKSPENFQQAYEAARYTDDTRNGIETARPVGRDGLELSDEAIANLDYGYHAFHHNTYVDAVEQAHAMNEAGMAGSSLDGVPKDAIESFMGLHEHNGDLNEATDQLTSGLLASYGMTNEEAAEAGFQSLAPESAPGLDRVPTERPETDGD